MSGRRGARPSVPISIITGINIRRTLNGGCGGTLAFLLVLICVDCRAAQSCCAHGLLPGAKHTTAGLIALLQIGLIIETYCLKNAVADRDLGKCTNASALHMRVEFRCILFSGGTCDPCTRTAGKKRTPPASRDSTCVWERSDRTHNVVSTGQVNTSNTSEKASGGLSGHQTSLDSHVLR